MGLVALLVTMGAWTTFALSSRAIAHSTLSAVDVGAVRYLVPALLTMPWWRRAWSEVKVSDRASCALISASAGLPFFFVTALGARWSTAGHVTVVNLGATPVMCALIAAGLGRGWPDRFGQAALGVVAAGIAVLAIGSPGAGLGVVVLLGSALLWSVYTLAQDRARLSATTVIVVMAVPSGLVGAVLALPHLADLAAAPDQLAVFALTQGIGAGVVSTVGYTLAVRHLGATVSGLIGALAPLPVLVLSSLLFDERLPGVALFGLALVAAGIAAEGVRRLVGRRQIRSLSQRRGVGSSHRQRPLLASQKRDDYLISET